ncbi:MAG: 50S ribosomal protein L11 methyltransferase [Desulfobacterales bacterium]|nr:MAG: 50S ribosomal protein L11 methyltransferase [Desulfobacterales bacterium]
MHREMLAAVAASPSKLTPSSLEKTFGETFKLSRAQVRRIIKELVAAEELVYTYQFGCSFLEISFDRPVRISHYVVLKPPRYSYRSFPGDVVLSMQSGASFGTGRHPTTRLAIRGIEYALSARSLERVQPPGTVLDIGTGSGVLVLTAVKFGMRQGLGIDIDVCACAEARENVALNGLADRIEISDQGLETIAQRFAMLTANLRYPTLKKNASRLDDLTLANGILVLAGMRDDELEDLLASYAARHFACLWQGTELGWGGVVLQKSSP